ncbi:hypothetical protein HK097_010682 [Rhizophlyctis rosea]|uniref:Uncharacterized protein n=1 Tax=Rhizophlyctis rosea TaxID=64517 RepID=A0AAD5S8P9_9FUNG|nr:hypothetical protein HK097_010682 [Rhizophlyctis rosea]
MSTEPRDSYIQDFRHFSENQSAEAHLDAALGAPQSSPPEALHHSTHSAYASGGHHSTHQHHTAHSSSSSSAHTVQSGHAAEAAGTDAKGQTQRREAERSAEADQGVGSLGSAL